MYSNPETIETFKLRSGIVSAIRSFMDEQAYLEVETPMLQPIVGGAAARSFQTHHNALDMSLYLRIAPELYLKRLLVGGMRRVYEINRNFRNEGISRSHNPEFTMLEAYQAFGDCETMLTLTEGMVRVAASVVGDPSSIAFGEHDIDYAKPFERIAYGTLFENALGIPMADEEVVRAKATELHIDNAATRNHWLLVGDLFEEVVEGLSISCKENSCALIGGETAEMPDFYKLGDYDISGTIVGVAEKGELMTNRGVNEGDFLIGLPSTGLHTNGYSLARKVLLEHYDSDDFVDSLGKTIGEALLAIHKSYLPAIDGILQENWMVGISHITGGGIVDNTRRILNENQDIEIDWDCWERPAIF